MKLPSVPKYTPPTLEQLADPSYQMSMPSHNPLDELGYTAQHQEILRNPLARLTYDPSMHFYPETGIPRAWGAVNPLNEKLEKQRWDEKSTDTKRSKAMTKAIKKAFPKGKQRDMAMQEAIWLDQALRGEGMIFSDEYQKYRPNTFQIRASTKEMGEKGGTPMHEEMHKGLMKLHQQGKLKNRPVKDKGAWDHDIIDMYFYRYGNEYQKTEARRSLMDRYDNIAVVDKVIGSRLQGILNMAADLFPSKEAFEDVLKAGDIRVKVSGKKKRF